MKVRGDAARDEIAHAAAVEQPTDTENVKRSFAPGENCSQAGCDWIYFTLRSTTRRRGAVAFTTTV